MDRGDLYRRLVEIFGKENVSVTYEELVAYGEIDNRLRKIAVHVPKYRERFLPDAVVTPTAVDQIVGLVRFANEHKIPIIPMSAGTSLVGHLIPVRGGIIVDLRRMNRIKEINTRARYAIVEPGVLYKDLNDTLYKRGFWFPPDPGSAYTCCIGGMVGTNSSGMKACKYGTTSDFVIGLEVVLPTGELVRVGGRVLKSSSGLDLKRLFVGSEGTLGIFTEIILRIDPKPAFEVTSVATFEALDDACEAAASVLGAGIIPASMELTGPIATHAINLGLPDEFKLREEGVEANLLIRTDGSTESAAMAEMDQILGFCRKHGAVTVERYDPERAEKLWRARGNMASLRIRAVPTPPEHTISADAILDIGVPLDRIPEFVRGVTDIARKYGFGLLYFGHIGDGNIHISYSYPFSKENAQKSSACEREFIEFAIGLGGTISAEHGIGVWKAHLMSIEHGSALDLMRRIKKALDPNDIMNPGKNNLDFVPEFVDYEDWFREE